VERRYFKWRSDALGCERELLVFGSAGERVLVFPTRDGRFYDYENWGMVGAATERIERGEIQLYCVDSMDRDSLYADWAEPRHRIKRHLEFERYLIDEVVPFSETLNPGTPLVTHGCSLGAYHAVNLAFRHPKKFGRVVALSGRYDLTEPAGGFRDLFDGYYDDDVYYNNPSHFVARMWDPEILTALRRMKIVLCIGREDAFFANNVQFGEVLKAKQIPHILEIWETEAHRPRYWRPMIEKFL
jgi:esterase/lipase superfamily enzyme